MKVRLQDYLNMYKPVEKTTRCNQESHKPFGSTQKEKLEGTKENIEYHIHLLETDGETQTPPQNKARRKRTIFTSEQIMVMETKFQMCEYLQRTERILLADELNLPERQIKVWFQNRRMKEKKKKKELSEENTVSTTLQGFSSNPCDMQNIAYSTTIPSQDVVNGDNNFGYYNTPNQNFISSCCNEDQQPYQGLYPSFDCTQNAIKYEEEYENFHNGPTENTHVSWNPEPSDYNWSANLTGYYYMQ